MRILARVHLFPPDHCAGAERMLEELLVSLQKRGHQVDVYLAKGPSGAAYDYRGLTVHRRGADWHRAAIDADVLVTHLDQTSEVVGVASVLSKPLVQVLHNTHAPTKMWANCKSDLLVFNSEWMKADFGMEGLVVRPPVWAQDYRVAYEINSHGYVTLVNSSYRKGGLMLGMLAATMPHMNFLIVKGAYGEQLEPQLPNVRVVEHGADMRKVYSMTKILLMPSHYESWGRVGVEAMASGIPVLANRTPGLLESLGPAGIFCETLTEYQIHLDLLQSSPAYYSEASKRAYKRSAELDPTDDLNRWIEAVERL